MEVFLPIAQVFINPIEILLLSAIVGVLSGLFGVGGGFLMTPFLIFMGIPQHTLLQMKQIIFLPPLFQDLQLIILKIHLIIKWVL